MIETQKTHFRTEQELSRLGIFGFMREKELKQKLELLAREKERLFREEAEQRKALLATRNESLPIIEKERREIEKSIKEITRQAELDSGYTPNPKS